MTGIAFDDPDTLAREVIAARPRPLVIGLDVDGVLAPIVGHADEARLAVDVGESLDRLHAIDGVTVAVVSGRSLAGLEQFGFSAGLTVIGGHGGEVRGEPAPELTDGERATYDELDRRAEHAAATAGAGAWVERKPSSVVLHVRQADPRAGADALGALRSAAADLDGVTATPGDQVLELFARPASKGRAMGLLRERHHPATMVYVGDDVTDEDAFRALAGDGLCFAVFDAPRPTAAGFRLADTGEVRLLLQALADAVQAQR